MDTTYQCRQLVANYLKSNGYDKTLSAFEAEAGPLEHDDVPPAGTASAPRRVDASREAPLPFDLPKLVEAWMHQESLAKQLAASSISGTGNFEDGSFDWHTEIPSDLPKAVSRTLRHIHQSGILSVTACQLPRRVFNTSNASYESFFVSCIVTSGVDKRVAFTNTTNWTVEDDFAPCKSVTLGVRLNPVYPFLMLTCAMDGSCTITNLLTRASTTMKEHSKYVVRASWSDDGLWFCTLGYDRTLCIYETLVRTIPATDSIDTDEFANLPEFSYALRWKKSFPSNPEACTFLPGSTHLAFTRRDDNHLYYVSLPPHASDETVSYPEGSAFNITKYNLNENQDSHVSFCVLSMAIHPSRQAISLQTDTAICRIILLPFHSSSRLRENLYTSSEQSEFSNPRHAWLENGSAVAVSSDDGILRLVDLNGRVRASIGAHGVAGPAEEDDSSIPLTSEVLRARYEADRGSSVIRDLCVLPAGESGSVRIVSVGLDKTVRVMEA